MFITPHTAKCFQIFHHSIIIQIYFQTGFQHFYKNKNSIIIIHGWLYSVPSANQVDRCLPPSVLSRYSTL